MLPNEVLRHIFSFLQPKLLRKGLDDYVADCDVEEEASRQLALSCLLRASKQFYQLALPFIYHTIPAPSFKLLGVLSQNANLAARVKAINLSSFTVRGTSPVVLLNAFEAARPRLDLPDSFEQVLLEAIHAVD